MLDFNSAMEYIEELNGFLLPIYSRMVYFMWKLSYTAEFNKTLQKWPKKYKRELGAMLANLETVVAALRKGAKTAHIQYGFLHPEPGGVWAIDQKGGGSGLTQSRLYVYAHSPQEIIHVITMGDKSTQTKDVEYSKAYADGVKGSEDTEVKDTSE